MRLPYLGLGVVIALAAASGVPAAASEPPPVQPPPVPFPVEITPSFDLVDHRGERVTDADFHGQPTVVFFGYVSCSAICSVAIPRIVEALESLGSEGAAIVPIIITVDPVNDTPEAMAAGLASYGERLVGLTGSAGALADARRAFQVEVEEVGALPDGTPLFAHGSFIYLIGGDGVVRSMIPPILGVDRMAALLAKHLGAPASRPGGAGERASWSIVEHRSSS